MKVGNKIILTVVALACLAFAPSNANAAGRYPAAELGDETWQARAQVLLDDSKQLVREFQQLEARLALLEKDIREAKGRRLGPDGGRTKD